MVSLQGAYSLNKSLSEQQVLIVDDSRTSSILVKQQLSSIGVPHQNIMTVCNCQDAIREIETHCFNIIIIDYHLEQSLTGFELASILYRNKLIDDTIGILIISGDARQETVLTSLSGKVRHFISKPIQTKALGHRIQLIGKETQKIAQLRTQFPIDNEEKLHQALLIVNGEQACLSSETALMEHLIEGQYWNLLDIAISESQTPEHPTKIIGQAHVFRQNNLIEQGIDALHTYLIKNPLSLKIIDALSVFYEEQGELAKALYYANKSFDLTPSISQRATRASELAERLGKRDTIIRIGYTYASHISLADHNWIQSVSSYLLALESCYKNAQDQKVKQVVLKHLGNFVALIGRRFTPKRNVQMRSMTALFQCHILIHEHKLEAAHQKLLKGLSLFYDNLSDCPSSLLAQYLPALMYFGESNLCHSLNEIIQARGKFDSSLEQMHRLFSFTTVSKPHNTLDRAEQHLGQYPLSVSAKLDYLYTISITSDSHTPMCSHPYLNELSKLDLPPNWSRWIGESIKNGFSTRPPNPFTLSN
ncbi:response regulator [Vibrio sp. RE86]|nr:response regulator [Vibrio sp. RE86]